MGLLYLYSLMTNIECKVYLVGADKLRNMKEFEYNEDYINSTKTEFGVDYQNRDRPYSKKCEAEFRTPIVKIDSNVYPKRGICSFGPECFEEGCLNIHKVSYNCNPITNIDIEENEEKVIRLCHGRVSCKFSVNKQFFRTDVRCDKTPERSMNFYIEYSCIGGNHRWSGTKCPPDLCEGMICMEGSFCAVRRGIPRCLCPQGLIYTSKGCVPRTTSTTTTTEQPCPTMPPSGQVVGGTTMMPMGPCCPEETPWWVCSRCRLPYCNGDK